MTIIGLLVGVVLIFLGYRPKRFGWSWYFEIGLSYDGFSLGPFFFCGKYASNATKAHEYGHSFQNCKYGIVMIFLTLASIARYWYYTIAGDWLGMDLPKYDTWWFESQATKIGTDQILNTNK
jgi:hypothetical protein